MRQLEPRHSAAGKMNAGVWPFDLTTAEHGPATNTIHFMRQHVRNGSVR
jgi:hypothetical protein